MSKTKRFLAVLCTVAMLFSNVVPVSVPVYAAETESDPEYSNLIAEIEEEQVSDALDETEENKTPETLPEETSQETESDGEVADRIRRIGEMYRTTAEEIRKYEEG